MRQLERNKHATLKWYAGQYGTKVFVETGTYRGDTVKAMLKAGLFDQVHTVDIYRDRVNNARKRFCSFPYVKCWHGDSAEILPRILSGITQPALFWLDAHHSGKQIARKKIIETPLVAELTAVLQQSHEHIILIDDANYYRKFGEKLPDYPTISDIESLVDKYHPDWTCREIEDIIRIHRPGFDFKIHRGDDSLKCLTQ